MLTFKKKSLKVLWVVCLVGITLALLSMNIFAEIIIPDTAIQDIKLNPYSKWYKMDSVMDSYQKFSSNTIGGFSTSDIIKFSYVYAKLNSSNSPLFQNNYTYYIHGYINFYTQQSYYDFKGAYIGETESPNNTRKALSSFPEYAFFLGSSHPREITIMFRCNADMSSYTKLFIDFYGSGITDYSMNLGQITEYYDVNGTVYQSLVNENLSDINNKLDTTNEELSDVNDNLVSIDTNIDSLNDNNTQLLNGVQRKIDEQSAQQHQDAEDIKDELEDLPQRQYEYEHDREQTELNQLLDSFDENSELAPLYDYLDPDNINEAMGNIWTSLSHNNKVYDIIFPSSGNVPLIDATLWDSQVIHLADFTETVPGRLLIAACNGVFALSFIVGIIVFINRAISDTFKT